ncbi:MAG: carbamate kinase [Actinomycetales bacterium]|nr:MAG: carbamate kinase [Actinomycetales bacterium]
MLVVIALGGNAILRRGEPMSVSGQRETIAEACGPLAQVAREHALVVSHGNGPQVGLLALQAASFDHVSEYPFDVLGAQTEGMLGYLIEQELGNVLGNDRPIATLVTRTLVDPADPAFRDPTKFVGPVYTAAEAQVLVEQHGWSSRIDGSGVRRVVPSPVPLRILETKPIRWILERGGVVICAGGGGVPTTQDRVTDVVVGIEAVIDKDLASAVLGRDLGADVLVIATDVDGVYAGWGGPDQRLITAVHPDSISPDDFAAGSMGPKVRAAAQFARETGGRAVIGSLQQIAAMFAGTAGTLVSNDVVGIHHHNAAPPTGTTRAS